jgi:hypothetical protein
VLNLVDGIPNFFKTIREGVQFAKLGPSAMFAATSAERVPYDLTSQPYFQTPDGSITCGLPYFHWSSDMGSEPPNVSQAVLCRRAADLKTPPPTCNNLHYEAAPGVYMEPSQYASFGCVGMETDKEMYFQPGTDGGFGPARDPYHAQNDQNISLGPVTCFVQTSSVDCTSAIAPRSFYFDATSFHSPLSPGDSVLAAENHGSPYTMASTGVARPASYQWGQDEQFTGITWSQWDSSAATGTGTYAYNTCTPQCAAGNYRTDQNVTIAFANPMIVCGQWFFTQLTVTDPANSTVSGKYSIAPDSYNSMTTPDCLPPGSG